jgi:hypothetical protein
MGEGGDMKRVLGALLSLIIFLSSCNTHQYYNYSNTSFKAYKYDSRWDFRGYDPHTVNNYRTYDPERKDPIQRLIDTTEKYN